MDGESEDEDEVLQAEPSFSPKNHRVATKGVNPPQQAASFAELRDRYSLAPQLLNNLDKSGYHIPTAIQASGMPVLLEVSVDCMVHALTHKPSGQGFDCHLSDRYW